MRAVLSLGSNLGDSAQILNMAATALNEFGEVIALSNFLANPAIGGPPQPEFLNAVLILETSLEPAELLTVCQGIENVFGRSRQEHWGPRTLDIDLISCDNFELESLELILPHPKAHQRAFVLEPWIEIDKGAYLPGKGSASTLLAEIR